MAEFGVTMCHHSSSTASVTPDGAASAASTRDSTWCMESEPTLFDNMVINVTMDDVVMSRKNHKNIIAVYRQHP